MTTPLIPEDPQPAIPLGEYPAHAEPKGVFGETPKVKEPEREEDVLQYEAALLKKEEDEQSKAA